MRGVIGLVHYWPDSNAFARITPLVPRLLMALKGEAQHR